MSGNPEDKFLLPHNVRLFTFKCNNSLRTKLIEHSFFWYNLISLRAVLNTKTLLPILFGVMIFQPYFRPIEFQRKLNANLVYDSHEIYLETLSSVLPYKYFFY